MTYPTLEQYNEALQYPQLALVDPVFKAASIAKTGLGLPLALCGGFALTYAVTTGGKKFAVRCFHKQSNALETRYDAISERLRVLRSPYFLDFKFQPQGVRVNHGVFPIVKMAWASGLTLGEFLATRYGNKASLDRLVGSLADLATYLDANAMAHGDIQPGNIMVADDGGSVQLIDYDGMYVESLRSLGSAELGLRNFQHPHRTARSWDAHLDRFSFITLNVALRALADDPSLWSRHQADENSLLFKANDFAQPGSSSIFRELFARADMATIAKDFAAVCGAAYEQTPTLADFLARRNIPPATLTSGPATASKPAPYLSAFPVLAADYAQCLGSVGDRIEVIGRVAAVRQGTTRHGKPYTFVNFGEWRGDIVKIAIWSEGLNALGHGPDASWVGRWVSVVGLLEPPYVGKGNYSHLSVTVTQTNQIHQISEREAAFRLAESSIHSTSSTVRVANTSVLDAIHGTNPKPGRRPHTPPARGTPNAQILQAMKTVHHPQTPPRPIPPALPYAPLGMRAPPPPPRTPVRSTTPRSVSGIAAWVLLAGLALVFLVVAMANSARG